MINETLYTLFHLNTTEIFENTDGLPQDLTIYVKLCLFVIKKTFTSRLKSEHNTTTVNMVSQEEAFKSQLI